MANIKSQIKRNRQNELARQRNKSARSILKTKVKKVLSTIEAGDAEAAREAYRDVVQSYDKAAAKNIVHKNKAANVKSRLARKLPS